MYKIEEILNTIIQGNSLEVLKKIPTESISLICCSSPYWGLRDYEGESIIWDGLEDCDHNWVKTALKTEHNPAGKQSKGTIDRVKHEYKHVSHFCQVPTKLGRLDDHLHPKNPKAQSKKPEPSIKCGCGAWKGQLGLEPDFNMFIDHLMQIFEECKRILRKDGALWVNLGDTYYGGGNASGHTDESKNFGLSTLKRGMVTKPVARGNQLKNKTLVGIPDRFKIAMIDNGWICRNEIVWHKPNAMPSSVKDRFTVDFEKFFFFVKSRNYYFEQQFEPIHENTINKWVGGKTTHKKYKNNSNYAGNHLSKYDDKMSETLHRQGMNKDRGNAMIRKRNLPDQKEFVDWLRENIPDKEKTAKITRNERDKIDHWYRYDSSGFAWPSPGDWEVLMRNTVGILENPFPGIIEYWEEPDTIDNNVLGRNKRAVWSINTKPFPGAHFAVFPEELIEPIIKSCVPKQICTRCDKPRERIIRIEGGRGKSWHNHKDDLIDGQSKSASMPNSHQKIDDGLSRCGCNSKFEPGVVLDCFMGAGTTGVVASNQKKNWVGIELNPEYIEMSMKRINLNNRRLAKLENIKHQQNRI